MDFGLSDEQQLLVGTVRRFVEGELIPLEDEIEASGRLDRETAKAIF
jgi:acyl-CoA dehydrogenase